MKVNYFWPPPTSSELMCSSPPSVPVSMTSGRSQSKKTPKKSFSKMTEKELRGSLWWKGHEMTWDEGGGASEIIPRLVLRLSGCEVVLQKGLQILKGGPLLWVLLPALHHELVQGGGAVLRARHPVASLHLLQNLAVVHAWGRGQIPSHSHWPHSKLPQALSSLIRLRVCDLLLVLCFCLL